MTGREGSRGNERAQTSEGINNWEAPEVGGNGDDSRRDSYVGAGVGNGLGEDGEGRSGEGAEWRH